MSTTAEQKIERLRPRVPCPECGKDSTRRHFPFCSPRCKDIDLNRWLSGSYVIPGKPEDDENGSE
ncbi:MAG: DNA gyrase inhibitor YacG [Rhizobiaceae bacterium]